MKDNEKNNILMIEVIQELQKHTKKINVDDELDDISFSLMEFTPKEVSHKYSLPLSAVEKLADIINSKLSKSDEISLTLFLKKMDFNYDHYDFFDPRDMFFIIGSKLTDMSIQEVAAEENLSIEIVTYINDLIEEDTD